MWQFERDWLELDSRAARSLHYQHGRNLRLLQAAQAAVQVMAEELAQPALGDDDHDRG